jgi:hypothetical protein
MPVAASNGLDPERFAALWAGCDTGNANEAEAVNKFRALRRMVVADNVRIVDVMGRADVVQALDVQLQPLREESPQLKEAFGQITKLADALAREREITAELREELAAVPVAENGACPARDCLGGFGAFAAVMLVWALMFYGAWHAVVAVFRWCFG